MYVLGKLKNLILYLTNTEKEMSNAGDVLEVLHTLLKLAEMPNRNASNLENCKQLITTSYDDVDKTSMRSNSYESVVNNNFLILNGSEIDSEGINSENDTEEFYMTADEGYEGDIEISHNDDCIEDMLMPFIPASNYKTLIVYEGISKIVIEILIDLSVKCLNEPDFWCHRLYQLCNRLYIIRESLGGSLFLIKGFSPILGINDKRLRDFQQSILDLITDLNNPEALLNYIKIMTTENPPIELLIKHLANLYINKVEIQPTTEIIFPLNYADGTIHSSSNLLFLERIKHLHNSHKHYNFESTFTQSAYITQLKSINFWNSEGFTISSWIEIKSSNKIIKSSNHKCGNENSDFIKDTHLISVGSDYFMLSIYINSNYNLVFRTNKINVQTFQKEGIRKSKSNLEMQSSSNTFDKGIQVKRKLVQTPSTSAENKGSKMDFKTDRLSLSNALRNTKIALLSSLSQFPLFNGSNETENVFDETEIELQTELKTNKWMHLCFGIEIKTNSILITTVINSSEKHTGILSCKRPNYITKAENFQILSFGAVTGSINKDKTLQNENFVQYSLSNILFFRKCFVNRSILANLTALGPDCVNLIQCQVSRLIPNYGLVKLKQINNFEIRDFKESLNILQMNLGAFYSGHTPHSFIEYESNNKYSHCELLAFAEVNSQKIPSIQTAIFLCGGLPCLLFLFARVVELTSDSSIQSLALEIVLTITYTDVKLFSEFIGENYLPLIGTVIKNDRCIKDFYLLQTFVNGACNVPVIMRHNSGFHVLENTTANIIYPELIVYIIQNYADWNNYGAKESHILDMVLHSLQVLVREKHPHQSFNLLQLTNAGCVKHLLNLCKIYVVEAVKPIFISLNSAKRFVDILRIFAGAPPSPSLLDEIIKLLVLLQKPSECFVTHERSNIYFLINPNLPTKNKKITIPLLPRQIKQTIGEKSNSNQNQNCMSTSRSPNSILNENSLKIRLSHMKNYRKNSKKRINRENWPVLINYECLKSIADCSQIKRKNVAFFKTKQFSILVSSAYKLKKPRENYCHNKKYTTPKVNRTKFKTYFRFNANRIVLKHKKDQSGISFSGHFDSITAKEYDVIDSDELSNLGKVPAKTKKLRNFFQSDYYNSVGIIKMQQGLLELLKDFVQILPDTSADEVLTHYIKIEILLVLANHENNSVRAGIVKLIAALCDRLPTTEIETYTKKFYWYHLANQLSLNSADKHLVEACLTWITGKCLTFETMQHSNDLKILKKIGLNSLIAILPQTYMRSELVIHVFNIVENIYRTDCDHNSYMIENGLLQAAVKTLYNIYLKQINLHVEMAITSLLVVVAERSITSTGHINVLWDLLNLLSYYQIQEGSNIVDGFRAIQANIFIILLQKLNAQNVTFKIPKNLQLSYSEMKTRFDLLIDKSVQFFTNSNLNHTVNYEDQLFEILLNNRLIGNSRCNNLIIWGLDLNRSFKIKNQIIDIFWKWCENKTLSTITCDEKIIKALFSTNLSLEDENDAKINVEKLSKICNYLSVTQNDGVNLENILDKIESSKKNCLKEQKAMIIKTITKFESIAQSCIDSSMIVTRIVVDLQNSERKLLMTYMKQYNDDIVIEQWTSIIRNMTHEGGPWYFERGYPRSWELDDTEGPSRIRNRLRRCNLEINPRFRMKHTIDKSCNEFHPLSYLKFTQHQRINFPLNSLVLFNFSAKYLPVDYEIDGELIITENQLFFFATHRCKFYYVTCDIKNITEVWMRRYEHQEKGFEFFLDTNKSLFFIIQNKDDKKIMIEIFGSKLVQNPEQSKLVVVTQQWREGFLTNWEYLITLNQISGRTYNDLMQYPVFPWILSDYESQYLDLTNKNYYRKLEKPIAVQHKENETHYINNYTYIDNTMSNLGTLKLKPYHYSSHYSNSGTVLHFLVRIPPFTNYFLRYQDNNFDLPDRTFHSINTTWKLASKDSPTDVKELIPEFFCLPEMFENFEGFDFGTRQSGEIVHHVSLPAWCRNDPRLFVLIHRQALESEIVRKNLHHWIDLIFGYKQTGSAAIDAVNVFHPATYSEFTDINISDTIEQQAVQTMIKTYGQMPKQLFHSAHPPSNELLYSTHQPSVIPSVKGLRWGIYTGSLQLPEPRICNVYKLMDDKFASLISLGNNIIYGLSEKCGIMQGHEPNGHNLISWNNYDNIVRVRQIDEVVIKSTPLIINHPLDPISTCGCDPNSNVLWFGHISGKITVYYWSDGKNEIKNSQRNFGLTFSYNSTLRRLSPKVSAQMDDKGKVKDSRDLNWKGPITLIRHSDEVTAICISTAFKISVSVGRDGLAVIWDNNSFNYIRAIEGPAEIVHSPINLVAISPTLGDIFTVHTILKNNGSEEQPDECFEVTEGNLDDFVKISINFKGKSIIRLHSVNAKYINHHVLDDKVLSVSYSYIKEGVGINVIATGFEGGIIRLWSSWDLTLIRELVSKSDIISITYSTYHHLIVLDRDGYIHVWESPGLHGSSPEFPQILCRAIVN